MDFSLPEKNRNFLWNCLKNRNFSKICPEKSIFFVWNCLKIEILRKFPLKNRYFLWNYLNKIEIFRKFALKNRFFSLWNCRKNRNFLTRFHDSPDFKPDWRRCGSFRLKIDGNNISQVASTKFLGIYIDQFLTWDEHIKITANKLPKNIGIVRKISHLLPPKILTNLYYTLIDPYLTYGNIVWTSNYESRIRCLTLLQKKMIRIVVGDSFYAHRETR